jgi:hypothetical protein
MAARPMCTSSLGPGGSKTWTPPRRSPSGARNAEPERTLQTPEASYEAEIEL